MNVVLQSHDHVSQSGLDGFRSWLKWSLILKIRNGLCYETSIKLYSDWNTHINFLFLHKLFLEKNNYISAKLFADSVAALSIWTALMSVLGQPDTCYRASRQGLVLRSDRISINGSVDEWVSHSFWLQQELNKSQFVFICPSVCLCGPNLSEALNHHLLTSW